jgi:Zn-dependent protease
MAVLTVVFAFIFTQNNLFWGIYNGRFNLGYLPYGVALSFLGILTAFFFHEISHKFMAQKYGLWAEYRMFPQGLRLALILGVFTPVIFAAPGAVMFRGETRNFEMGRIAAAGPYANIIIAGITYVLYRFVFFETNLGKIFGFICLVNALLATFNLLPFGPLDGFKVMRWNGVVWSILLVVSIILLMFIIQVGIPKPLDF